MTAVMSIEGAWEILDALFHGGEQMRGVPRDKKAKNDGRQASDNS